jgi:hypothetical protein
MSWFRVSISDEIRAVDSQTAVQKFLNTLGSKTAQELANTYDVDIEEVTDESSSGGLNE